MNPDLRRAGIEEWEKELAGVGREVRRQEPLLSRDDFIAALTLTCANGTEHGSGPPSWLEMTQDEKDGSIALVTGLLYNRNGGVPAVNGNGHAVQLYEDRRAVDAFDAYHTMVTDQRGYAVEGLIKEGCTMIVSGLMGAGKSTFAMNLARAWFLGESFLERQTRQSKTLVVVSPKEYEAWADTIGFWKIKGGIFLIESTKAHFPKGDEQARWFAQEMDRLGCKTFVLDTLFDFFGMPPNNSGDQNRIVMNEQAPFLEMVRERMLTGLVLGHPPKSEATAIVSRDPEESFGGHTAWTAQHRMRGVIRRKSAAAGVNAFLTGKGGYGDQGILKEHMLLFDETNRLLSLGGPFSEYLGRAALPSVLEALDGWMSRSDLDKALGKDKKWTLAGLKEGLKDGSVKDNGRKGRAKKYALPDEMEQDELFN